MPLQCLIRSLLISLHQLSVSVCPCQCFQLATVLNCQLPCLVSPHCLNQQHLHLIRHTLFPWYKAPLCPVVFARLYCYDLCDISPVFQASKLSQCLSQSAPVSVCVPVPSPATVYVCLGSPSLSSSAWLRPMSALDHDSAYCLEPCLRLPRSDLCLPLDHDSAYCLEPRLRLPGSDLRLPHDHEPEQSLLSLFAVLRPLSVWLRTTVINHCYTSWIWSGDWFLCLTSLTQSIKSVSVSEWKSRYECALAILPWSVLMSYWILLMGLP